MVPKPGFVRSRSPFRRQIRSCDRTENIHIRIVSHHLFTHLFMFSLVLLMLIVCTYEEHTVGALVDVRSKDVRLYPYEILYVHILTPSVLIHLSLRPSITRNSTTELPRGLDRKVSPGFTSVSSTLKDRFSDRVPTKDPPSYSNPLRPGTRTSSPTIDHSPVDTLKSPTIRTRTVHWDFSYRSPFDVIGETSDPEPHY